MTTADNKFIIPAIAAIGAIGLAHLAFKATRRQQNSTQNDGEVYQRAPKIYYTPDDPSEVSACDYDSNPTVFGKLLRGELPARVLLATKDWFVFEDISPRAPLHALIIPKQRIRSVLELKETHLPFLRDIEALAINLVAKNLPLAHERGDFKLCFHIPPLNTVDHLHLHVLAPCSQMSSLAKSEFHTSGENCYNQIMRWNILLSEVIERLEQGLSPTPFVKDYRWTAVIYDTLSSLKTVLVPGERSNTIKSSL